MLSIRFQRVGRRNNASYRIVVAEKRQKTKGKCLEVLGYYNPYTKKASFKVERINYWLSKGAKLSGSVNNLLINNKIIKGKKQNVLNQRFVQKKAAEEFSAEKPQGVEGNNEKTEEKIAEEK